MVRYNFWLWAALLISTVQSHNITSSDQPPSASVSAKSTSAAVASNTPATTPTGTPQAPAQKNSKRGLAFAAGDTPGDLINANQSASVITWLYDWGTTPAQYLIDSNIPYVPMQWGSGQINALSNAMTADGAKILLGFNEPDFAQESNIDPVEAANLWMQYIEPFHGSGVRLGAPAVTANGRPWLASFFSACTSCHIDFIPFHWYGSGVEGFYDYIWGLHTQFPTYPLWVTEFAETSTNDTVVAQFMNTTITYMDTLDWIERYAWFGFFRPRDGVHYNLLDENGGLNTLGQIYTGAKTIHTSAAPSPSSGYKTVDGADNPSQARVSVFPAASGAALASMNIPVGALGLFVFPLIISIVGLGFGTIWTLF